MPGSNAQAESATAHADAVVAPNYRYWQEHGGEWGGEYDQRKTWSVKYHIAEIMLSEYIRNHAPARVLEFGCGVGRHLRHLAQLDGIEVHGYDQSPTMVEQCARWADPAWFAQRVRLGPPIGRLPYEDAAFDVVYTSEVLVHVRPEDLPGILAELIRICRGHVLHLEPAPHTAICAEAHDGCWNHDLVAAYAAIGRTCERLDAGYDEHAPYRVTVAAAPRYTWPAALLALLRRMESDLRPTLAAGREVPRLREQLAEADRALETARTANRAAHYEYAVLFGKLEAVQRELAAAREEAQAAARRADLAEAAVAAAAAREAELAAARASEQSALAAVRAERDLLAAERERLRAATAEIARLQGERDEFLRRAHALLG